MDKKYDHKTHEKTMQDAWDNQQTYSVKNNTGQLYSIDTPPPTVSGNLHLGHIFSYTQTDIVARYQRMNGYCVFYPFGFDDNGLPTERYVEKKRKVSAHKLGRTAFIKVCLEETDIVEQEFMALWKRIGLSADWKALYSTISPSSRKISQESFIRLYKKRYIYRKNEPAPFCTACRTSVAQAELDDTKQAAFFNDIVFKDEKGNDLIIGTTRPELLSSCVALLYHPEDERYQYLKGTQAIVPIFEYKVPIYPDKRVDIEKGTGLVMCCTFGDSTDIQWYKDLKLPYKQSIGLDGKWVKETGILADKKAAEARQTILDALREKNLLLSQREIMHVVNVHERCKKEIEYLMLPQWFLNIMDHKEKFIEQANQILWYPPFMKARYLDWVHNIGWDWCLSRQRFYGIPFPVWHCQSCGQILLAAIKNLPIDPQETPYPGKTCDNCGSSDIVPDTDVMDTWNTSSLTPYLCQQLYSKVVEDKDSDPFDAQINSFIPMNMRPQAHDIIRTWAFYTIAKAWMHHNTIPWKEIVISGHVLSNDKEKLSKSKEHKALDPITLLEHFPADVIRYWTACGTLGHDTTFSDTQFKIGQRTITKLWNAFRFLQEHTPEQQQTADLSINLQAGILSKTEGYNIGMVNQWLLDKATKCFDDYQDYFAKHEFSLALQVIEKFFWHTFCDNYLELIKHQLFNPDKYEAEYVTSTKTILYHVGLRIIQLYAPYIPHVTDTIYQELYKQGVPSLHQTKFAIIQQPFAFRDNTVTIDGLIEAVTAVRKLKTEKQLSLKAPLQKLTIFSADMDLLDNVGTQEQLLRGITQAEEITYKVSAENRYSIKEHKDGTWHAEATISFPGYP